MVWLAVVSARFIFTHPGRRRVLACLPFLQKKEGRVCECVLLTAVVQTSTFYFRRSAPHTR